MTYSNDAYVAADQIIANLKEQNRDYSSVREEIAEVFDTQLWEGNWDCTTNFDDLPNLRIIQEDEYDNGDGEYNIEGEDGYEIINSLCFVFGHYVFDV